MPSQPGAHPVAGLEAFPAVERFGLVWTRLGRPSGPGDVRLEHPPEIPETDAAQGWAFADGRSFDVACGLRSITENFAASSR